ncbi:transposase [Pleurocapsales cyanobacterium LEGE 06147]|nr:transposase [Pleurocapsales cyanobacterium LEGE 06147]
MKTYSQSLTTSVADSTDSEKTRLKSKKIRVYPEAELNKEWRKWLAGCRFCFNRAIDFQRKAQKRIGKLQLRNLVMQSDLPTWVKEVPCHIRQNAIFDAHLAFTASRKQGTNKSEAGKFRKCTKCGQIHRTLGGNKKFKCPHCGYEIDRDFNGAFGIFLKALKDTSFVSYIKDIAIVTLSEIVKDNVA